MDNKTYAFYIGSGGGIWYDHVHGCSAIFSYVYIAGGGVDDSLAHFHSCLSSWVLSSALTGSDAILAWVLSDVIGRKRRHLGFGFERLFFSPFLALLGRSFARFIRW